MRWVKFGRAVALVGAAFASAAALISPKDAERPLTLAAEPSVPQFGPQIPASDLAESEPFGARIFSVSDSVLSFD
ncbi:MAG: hypothetical protein AAF322_03465 [Pseudomonadota bacterium]